LPASWERRFFCWDLVFLSSQPNQRNAHSRAMQCRRWNAKKNISEFGQAITTVGVHTSCRGMCTTSTRLRAEHDSGGAIEWRITAIAYFCAESCSKSKTPTASTGGLCREKIHHGHVRTTTGAKQIDRSTD